MISYHYASNDASLLNLSQSMYDAYIDHFDIEPAYLQSTLLPEKNSVHVHYAKQTRPSRLNEICLAVHRDIDSSQRAAGMMVLTQEGFAQNCRLGRVIVKDGYRSQGIGKSLINQVIAYARENGAKKILLDVNFPHAHEVPPSYKLYCSVGFKQVGTTGYRRADDTKLMVLEITQGVTPTPTPTLMWP